VKGFGIIVHVDPELTVEVYTKVDDEVDIIHLSSIKLVNNLNNEFLIPILKQGFQENFSQEDKNIQ